MTTIKQLIADSEFAHSNLNITDENFPIEKEPSIKGAVLEEYKAYTPVKDVLDDLKSRGRRPASAAELLMYSLENPKEMERYWLYALGQVVVIDGFECVLVLYVGGDGLSAGLYNIARGVGACDSVLSFPQELPS